jgi:hypothetical protein
MECTVQFLEDCAHGLSMQGLSSRTERTRTKRTRTESMDWAHKNKAHGLSAQGLSTWMSVQGLSARTERTDWTYGLSAQAQLSSRSCVVWTIVPSRSCLCRKVPFVFLREFSLSTVCFFKLSHFWEAFLSNFIVNCGDEFYFNKSL